MRDAIVKLGKPMVPGLAKRLNSSTRWPEQLEVIFLLGLIGENTPEAREALERATKLKHPLPRNYAEMAFAAIQRNPQPLADVIKAASYGRIEFEAELLRRMGPKAAEVRPQLIEAAKASTNNPTRHRIVTETIKHIDSHNQ